MSKKVVEFTLPDSGVTVRIKRIGPALAKDLLRNIQQAITKPKPPMQEVLLGDEKKMEPNLSYPDYLAAMRDYNGDLGMAFIEALVKYGVDADIDAEAVAALREDDPDHHLPKSDLVVYVTRVALDSARDMSALQDAILGRFQPTEKAVAEAAATFPGQVQGA